MKLLRRRYAPGVNTDMSKDSPLYSLEELALVQGIRAEGLLPISARSPLISVSMRIERRMALEELEAMIKEGDSILSFQDGRRHQWRRNEDGIYSLWKFRHDHNGHLGEWREGTGQHEPCWPSAVAHQSASEGPFFARLSVRGGRFSWWLMLSGFALTSVTRCDHLLQACSDARNGLEKIARL